MLPLATKLFFSHIVRLICTSLCIVFHYDFLQYYALNSVILLFDSDDPIDFKNACYKFFIVGSLYSSSKWFIIIITFAHIGVIYSFSYCQFDDNDQRFICLVAQMKIIHASNHYLDGIDLHLCNLLINHDKVPFTRIYYSNGNFLHFLHHCPDG